jgi:hypothetical protein
VNVKAAGDPPHEQTLVEGLEERFKKLAISKITNTMMDVPTYQQIALRSGASYKQVEAAWHIGNKETWFDAFAVTKKKWGPGRPRKFKMVKQSEVNWMVRMETLRD